MQNKHKPFSAYHSIRLSNPSLYYSNRIQKEMVQSAKILGPSFWDVREVTHV